MFVKVARVEDVNPTKIVSHKNQEIALFNVDGRIYATQNNCPHRGGHLGEGTIEKEIVTCPDHGWRFNVTTGKNVIMPVSLKTYRVKVENGDIFIDV